MNICRGKSARQELLTIGVVEYNCNHAALCRQPRDNICLSPKYNQVLVDRAMEMVASGVRQIESAKECGEETLAVALLRYMQRVKWNRSIFQEKTGLNDVLYRKIKNKPNCKLELPIIVSICVGLGLTIGIANDVLKRGGYVLNNINEEDITYSMILSGLTTNNIIACNMFIEGIREKNPECKIRLLGSISYDE